MDQLPRNKISLSVGLEDHSYDILIAAGLLTEAGNEIASRFPGREARVVSDATVAVHYLDPLCRSLAAAGIKTGEPVIVPAGEASKSMAALEKVTETLLASRIERSTIVVALGGGVVGDLAGFAASILLRGLDVVQIPTTLLAQVDSSVGGKTGINTRAGKNLLGSFHQPRLVMADTDILRTLSAREMRSGYAEIVKYGLIVDLEFFAWLEENGKKLLAHDSGCLTFAIERSCAIKADIVTSDEHEHGNRALLNFGHTFAHALESLMKYDDRLTHGEAVAIGMIMALDLSVRQGLCDESELQRVKRHYENIFLPTSLRPEWGFTGEEILNAMQTDKKNANGRLRLILSRGVGKAFITDQIQDMAMRACLDHFTKA